MLGPVAAAIGFDRPVDASVELRPVRQAELLHREVADGLKLARLGAGDRRGIVAGPSLIVTLGSSPMSGVTSNLSRSSRA